MALMAQRLQHWLQRNTQRATMPDTNIKASIGKSIRRGVVLGIYEANAEQEDYFSKYRGTAVSDFTPKT